MFRQPKRSLSISATVQYGTVHHVRNVTYVICNVTVRYIGIIDSIGPRCFLFFLEALEKLFCYVDGLATTFHMDSIRNWLIL